MNEAQATVPAKAMKILQVIPYFTPKFGGDVNVCYNLSKQLAKNGHDVTIITTDYRLDTDFVREIEKFGVSVIPFRTVLRFGLFLYTPSINSWLKENVAEFDVIHLHNFRSYQNSCVSEHAKKNSIPYIIQPHGSISQLSDKQLIKRIYDRLWGQRILNNASLVFALTATEKNNCQINSVPENKIQIFPNGIDLKEFENLPERGAFRDRHDIPNDCQMILYLGRLHKSKGLDLLIDAICELNTADRDLQLIIIGPDDGYLQYLTQLIDQKKMGRIVRIMGYISPEEKIQAFIDSDVFVTPSYSGFPITFLEACACRTPIVTTNNGDRLDWINDTVGIVSDYNGIKLAENIALILDDSELRRRYGNGGILCVNKNFSLEQVNAQYEEICRAVIG